MKQTMQKIAIALCMALAFAACKNDDPETGGGVESVAIEPATLTLEVGKDTTLQAKINGVNSSEVTWKSDNTNVATVDNGKVTAKKEGTAIITATATADKTKTVTCTVTVKKADITVTLDQLKLTLGIGKDATLKASINGVVSTEVTWSSDKPDIASVDGNGKVTAVAKGTATITATATADKTKTATCAVTVEGEEVAQPSGIKVSPLSLSLNVGDTRQVTATIDNENELDAGHKEITWTSSNTSVATVNDNGLVTAVSAGTATITAATTNNKSATCTVTVTAQTTTPVAASDDEWNFVGKVNEEPYSDFNKDSPTAIDSDKSVWGEKGNLKLDFLKNGTKVGDTQGTPGYRYIDDTGLCIKRDALKIDGIKGLVTVTIQWSVKSSTPRNLEVTVNGETETKISGNTSGDLPDYTRNFDGGSEGTTLYIGTSEQLFFKSITIEPQSGGGTTTPTNPDPTDPDLSGKTISLIDKPLGYASKGTSYVTSGTKKEVSTRAELLAAIAKGGVIIIDGMIDMSEGKLPAAGSKSTDSTSALDALVHNTYSKYANYAAWVEAYSKACTLTTDDDKSGSGNSALQAEVAALNKAYGDLIKLTLKSGTTLIGKGPDCGIRGGSIQISNVSNIQIRNLTIQDAFDPFPHHEVNSSGKTDGYNAQWDGINIQNTCENIWIDHVTFEDTMTLGYVYTQGIQDDGHKEKWQTYDGLCDMKNTSTNITISNCIFRNHDKTMLIGSDDKDGDNSKRFVTLQGNYFYNCGQRLPMVRRTTIHILNNYYDASNPTYTQQYAVGCRKDSIIYAEANYFGSGIYYSFKDNDGTLYASGNEDKSFKKADTKTTDSALFSSAIGAYTYTPVTAEQAKTAALSSAGAGYTLQ